MPQKKTGRPPKKGKSRQHISISDALLKIVRIDAKNNGRDISGQIEWALIQYYAKGGE